LKALLTIFTLIYSGFLMSQSDSVMITELKPFNDGLYFTNTDHRLNKAISKENIVTNINKEKLNILLVEQRTPSNLHIFGDLFKMELYL